MNVSFSMANAMTYAAPAPKTAVTASAAKERTPETIPAREAPARGMSSEAFRSLFAAGTKKDAILSAASNALSSPKLKAPEHSKEMVRQRIEEIKKRINIFRNLYANDPKGMAKALAQVFKDLRSALKEYKTAGEQELGMSKDLSAGALGLTVAADGELTARPKADEAPADDDTASEKPGVETPADNSAETADSAEIAPPITPPVAAETNGVKATEEKVSDAAEAQALPATPTAPADAKDDRASLFGAVEQVFRKTIGEDVLSFTKQIGALVNYIEEKLLNPARLQMKARRPDKETEKAFEDVEKTLKELRKDIEDTARDIKQAVPTAGMHLDVTA